MDELTKDFTELCEYVEKLVSKHKIYLNCAAMPDSIAQISTKVNNEYMRFTKDGVLLKHKKGIDMNGVIIYMDEVG